MSDSVERPLTQSLIDPFECGLDQVADRLVIFRRDRCRGGAQGCVEPLHNGRCGEQSCLVVAVVFVVEAEQDVHRRADFARQCVPPVEGLHAAQIVEGEQQVVPLPAALDLDVLAVEEQLNPRTPALGVVGHDEVVAAYRTRTLRRESE